MTWANSPKCELFEQKKKTSKKKVATKEKEDLDNYEIAEYILNEKHLVTIRENEDICIYNNGVYERDKEKEVRTIIKEMCNDLGVRFSIQKRNVILEIIKTSTFQSIENFDLNKYIINLKNGLFDLKTFELKDHTFEYLSLRQIPVNYDGKMQCDAIDKFFSEIFLKKDLKSIYEIIGLCLTPIMEYQKAFMFYGDGNNGKTTFLNLLTYFIGSNNKSGVDISDFGKPFRMAQLEGKLVNIVSDISSIPKIIMRIRNFKLYVGNEFIISVNRKFKQEYDIKPTAKLLYSCNSNFPNVPNDTDKGFWRKWIAIECPYNFDDNADLNLLDKLITKNELSGLLNKALIGFKRLELRKGFRKKYNNWKKIKDLWMLKIDDFKTFLEEKAEFGEYKTAHQEPNNQYWEFCNDVVKIFNKWLKNKGKKAKYTRTSISRLINADPKYLYTRRYINKKREYIYGGFKLTDKHDVITLSDY